MSNRKNELILFEVDKKGMYKNPEEVDSFWDEMIKEDIQKMIELKRRQRYNKTHGK